MVHLLFAEFLEDEEAYHASENYWAQLQAEIVSSLGIEDDWRRWQPLYFGDGKTLMEPGNPIWDARSDALGRAIRIIQQAPTRADVPEITGWITNFADDPFYEGIDVPRAELTIGLALSEETSLVARELLQRWMTKTTRIDDMKALIQERLGVAT